MTQQGHTDQAKLHPTHPLRRSLSFLLDWAIIYYFLHSSMYLYLAIWGKRSLPLYRYYKLNHDVAFFNPLQLEAWHWWLILGGTLLLTLLIRTLGRSLGQRALGLALQSQAERRIPFRSRLLHIALWPIATLAAPFQWLVPSARTRALTRGLIHDRVSQSTVSTYIHPADTPRRPIWKTQWGWVTLGLLVITFVLGWIIVDITPEALFNPSSETTRQLQGFVNPDFSHLTTPEPGLTEQVSPEEAQKLTIVNLMVITILMALIATIVGALFAFPLSFLGARNMMKNSHIGMAMYRFIRAFFNLFRSIEILIWVAAFASWVGYGNAFTGILALILHTIAALGKLYSEQVEAIDPGPLEAIRAAGGSQFQIVRYGVIPQIVPSFLAFTLYRWDINVRMATIVSLVGGGGIGELLFWYRHKFNYPELGAVILAIIIVVWTLDYISGRVRERIV